MNKLKEHLRNYALHHIIFTVPVVINVICVLTTGKLLPDFF